MPINELGARAVRGADIGKKFFQPHSNGLLSSKPESCVNVVIKSLSKLEIGLAGVGE
jgi:hypothetical protein